MGVASPLGSSLSSLWEGVTSGQSGVVRLNEVLGAKFPFPFGGVVPSFQGVIEDFELEDPSQKKMIRKGLKLMCREIQLGVAAAQSALKHAGLCVGDFDPVRFGVSFGSDHIVTDPHDLLAAYRICQNGKPQISLAEWGLRGMSQITPLWLLKYLPNMPASHIAIYNDLRGPNNSLTLREVSGNVALGEASATIRRGAADRMLVGATGSALGLLRAVQTSFLGEIARDGDDPAAASRPFHRDRKGMVPGEGSGALVLEDYDLATGRNATVYGEVVGSGVRCVATRQGVGQIRCALGHAMAAALKSAALSPRDIGHIHAHGLSTQWGDREEALAIQDVLGPDAIRIPVVAAKANFGNLGAAGGVVELVTSLLAARHGSLFPIRNLSEPDPALPLGYVRHPGVPAGRSTLNLNFTPSGQAAAVLIAQP